MARKTAVDVALANIRERIAPLELELSGLRLAESALLCASDPDERIAPKAKRGRGKAKAKPGLPAAPDPDDEAARIAV